MRQNSYLCLIILTTLFGCITADNNKSCKKHSTTFVDKGRSNSYDVSFCINEALVEVPSIQWGTKFSKKFESKAESIIFSFSEDEVMISDAQLKQNSIDFGKIALKNSVLKNQNLITTIDGIKGVISKFSNDSLNMSFFIGYKDGITSPFQIIHQCSNKENDLEQVIKSIKIEKK